MTPIISVIMPVYNCETYVKEAVESILHQTYIDFEIIIIDDASTDNTLAIINQIKDSRIQLIEKPENTGYTNSLNYGLSIAKGTYIARMDGDDISLPERFMKQVAFLESRPDIVVCGTNYKIIGSGQLKLLPKTHEDIKIELLKNTCFGHPTVMIRREVLERYNLRYDIEKEPAEDYALWVTLLKYGKLHNLQEVLLYYRLHDDQVTKKRRNIQLSSKLSTRIKLFRYLGVHHSESELSVLRKVLSNSKLNINELLDFIKIKTQLIKLNSGTKFFEFEVFELYLNTIERNAVIGYFLKRQQFAPKIYNQYLKIKKQLHFKLPIKTDIIVLIKSLLFFRTKKYMK